MRIYNMFKYNHFALRRYGVGFFAVAVIICVSMSSLAFAQGLGDTEKEKLKLIKEAYLKMNKYYYKEVTTHSVGNLFYRCQFMMMSLLRNLRDDYTENLDRLTYSTINMIVDALKDPTDEYSKFIHKDYLKRTIREQVKSKFEGIGIEVEKRDVLFFVSTVYKKSSAEEQGVLVGDELIAIHGEPVRGWELEGIEKKLKIPHGDTVELTLRHAGVEEPYTVVLECRIIVIQTAKTKYYEDKNIGYIKISKFRSETAAEVKEQLASFGRADLAGLILDLRGNSGGDETQAVSLASLFLPDDTLVAYFLKRDVGRQEERTHGTPLGESYPIVILVNAGTASSSEIFSGAMRYYERAILVGNKTKGQGSLKNTIGLSDGSALFLITSRTYLANDETFDQKGLEPNFVVGGKEAQLDKAFEVIDNENAKGREQGA